MATTKEKPTVSDEIVTRAFDSWCYELEHQANREDYAPFQMTLRMAFAAGFLRGHKDGRASMVGAFIDFADLQQAKAK